MGMIPMVQSGKKSPHKNIQVLNDSLHFFWNGPRCSTGHVFFLSLAIEFQNTIQAKKHPECFYILCIYIYMFLKNPGMS